MDIKAKSAITEFANKGYVQKMDSLKKETPQLAPRKTSAASKIEKVETTAKKEVKPEPIADLKNQLKMIYQSKA